LSPVFSVKEGEETVVKIKTERAEAGVFSCTVTERNGLPIRNTKFMLYQDSYLTEAISDETGVLTIPYRKAYSMEGTLRIQANDGTINPMEGGAVAISLQETPNSTICFPQLTRQTVFIVNEEGKPVEYAELTIERDTNSIARSAMNFRCPEGGAGKYTFEVVPVGESYFYLTTFEKRVADTTYFQTPVVEPVYIDSVTNFRNVIAKQEITGDGDLYLTWHKPKTIEFHFVDQNNNPVPRILLFQIPLTYNRWNGNDFRFWLNDVEMSTTRIQMTGKDCWSDKDGTANFPLQSGMYPLIGFYHENYGLGFVQEDGQREGERLIRLRPACQVSMPPLDKIGFRYLAVMVEDGSGNAVSFVWSWSPLNESPLLFQPGSWKIASFQTDTEYPFILS
ncbi:MAG: hypothetical protein H3C48_20405, partial [Chitinophagaceae bacterium]|nr:hypothetical protein [Chitinophagaceae bacterium]